MKRERKKVRSVSKNKETKVKCRKERNLYLQPRGVMGRSNGPTIKVRWSPEKGKRKRRQCLLRGGNHGGGDGSYGIEEKGEELWQSGEKENVFVVNRSAKKTGKGHRPKKKEGQGISFPPGTERERI